MEVLPDVAARTVDEGAVHPDCVVCSPANARGLRVRYEPSADGGVEAAFWCDASLQGYRGRLHGGVIAALLDGAMTHCVFALGRAAVTAELTVSYRLPVAVDRPAIVRARLERDLAPLHLLRAELLQDGVLRATASAKFMEAPC
jgi:uncharacterized protein (TIGR00369 family)